MHDVSITPDNLLTSYEQENGNSEAEGINHVTPRLDRARRVRVTPIFNQEG